MDRDSRRTMLWISWDGTTPLKFKDNICMHSFYGLFFTNLFAETHRSRYHMRHNNLPSQQGILQQFIWPLEWIPLRWSLTTPQPKSFNLDYYSLWLKSFHAGFCICAIPCPCPCRVDVVAQFCNTDWLA